MGSMKVHRTIISVFSVLLVVTVRSQRLQTGNVVSESSEKNSGSGKNSESCECMEYWACASRNGQPYSYCGISDTEVCCFLPSNPKRNFTTSSEIRSSSSSSGGSREVTTTEFPSTTDKVSPFTSLEYAESPCGVPRTTGRVDGISRFREWPWHVAILEVGDDLYICGGTLVAPNRVITAAHCVQGYTRRTPRLKIRAGEYDVSTNDEPDPHVEVLVDLVAIHPQFDNSTLENDIAVLGLSRRITFTRNIQPICLPESGARVPTAPCVVTGWGRRGENTEHSIVLKEVVVPLWSHDVCQRRLRKNFGPSYQLASTTLCAGDKGNDACDGDGGGPLVCYSEEGFWVQQGVVSFGIGCGRPDSPGVYTKLSSYVNWVKRFLPPEVDETTEAS